MNRLEALIILDASMIPVSDIEVLAEAKKYCGLAEISGVLPDTGCSVSTSWSLLVYCSKPQTRNVSLALRKRRRKENATRGAGSKGLTQCLMKPVNPSLILMNR